MPLTQDETKALTTELGVQAAIEMQKKLDAYDEKAKKFAQEIVDKKGAVSEDSFKELKEATDKALEATNKILKAQGTTMAELQTKLGDAEAGTKSISEVLYEDKAEHEKIFEQGQGRKSYMLRTNSKGQLVAKPFSETKAAGPTGTIDGLAGGAVSSISQALDSATLLRVGQGSPIMSQYRNTPWLFDLCNTISASFGSVPFAMWYDEQPKAGASAKVTEGSAKPLMQYLYELMSDTYKKEAALVSFTEEFHLDFPQLESDIMGKARIDLINRLNSAILPDVKAKATPYSTGANFQQGVAVPNVNDFDVLAAMAAQVDNVTFGAIANSAIMSTFKKYRMGVSKNTQGSYLNPPAVINNLAFVGNPDMADDDVIVGDLKQYNIILRGGLIVRVGYNGTDMAENKYSTVLEQFYYNYISTIRTKAIVKGPDFATVRGLIAA